MSASFESGMKNLSLSDDPHQQIANQGQWFQASDSDEEDDQPLSSTNRPISVLMARPAHFIKPAAPPRTMSPPDMRIIQSLFDNYSQKVYIEGYVYRKKEQWSRWYAELCGSVLILWDAQFEGSGEQVMPQYMSVINSSVDLLGKSGEQGKDNVFSFNSAGDNQVLFDLPNPRVLQQWVSAIRLSCFEYTRLQEIFTRHFLSRSAFADMQLKTLSKTEGQVEVQLGANEWQKYWLVVSDKVEEKKLFGKKTKPSKGQIMLYESKKAKHPVLTITNVVQSYILYPESAKDIDTVTTFKIQANGETTTATIRAPSTKEMAQWVIGTFDTFKLYGRPDQPRGDAPRLFLELHEVSHINLKDQGLVETMSQFSNILLQKLQHQQQIVQQHLYARQSQQPMGLIHQIPSGAPMLNGQVPSPPRPNPQRMSTHSSQSSNMSNKPLGMQPQHAQAFPPPSLQQQQQVKANTNRKIYASDEESEEEDDDEEEEEEDDESDSDSVFNKNKIKTKESLLPNMQEDEGFASNVLGDIEKKSVSSKTSLHISQKASTSSTTDLSTKKDVKEEDNLSDSDDDDDEEEEAVQKPSAKPVTKRPNPKVARTQISVSGSDDSEEGEEEEGYSGSDDDDIPIHQQQQRHLQQQHQQPYLDYNDAYMQNQQWDSASTYNASQNMMMMDPHFQGYYDENGFPMMGEDGPIIPQLGDRFATQNSLLDTYRADRPSAHDQEGYARATGQPLIQVPNKPPEPRAGLVGMISQLEHEKKQEKSNKTRLAEMEKERILERERERYLLEQRQQMMQPMMNPAMNQSMSQSINQGTNPAMSQSMNPAMSQGMNPAMNQNMMMYPGIMPMMGGQMPMMNMNMMMYPGMMNMQMVPPMMDPRVSMMMMQQQYGQHPMWQQQQQMFNNRFNGSIQDDDEDEDDDVPLGTKEPSHTQKH
ncbi:uncharacterized protein B0P05DRAFT_590749 [Gilbertella persicaria]|uniref:uncharacterized protein n=1 Tax=Gilbertella persicaria TaxID=101096 RepID=UPI0022202D44|nr:uncharacterized protein B0P05DRAFT_590749 [Gilbertella persicaria]KAI8060638.1 hypothetical protein B0P05DRAFT_590749 [Gilbertella persicaria]